MQIVPEGMVVIERTPGVDLMPTKVAENCVQELSRATTAEERRKIWEGYLASGVLKENDLLYIAEAGERVSPYDGIAN